MLVKLLQISLKYSRKKFIKKTDARRRASEGKRGRIPVRSVGAIALAVLLLANVLMTPARAETSVDRGRNLYKLCQACHSLKAGVTLVGPSLHGLFGRRAAGDESFTYSDAFYGADFAWSPVPR